MVVETQMKIVILHLVVLQRFVKMEESIQIVFDEWTLSQVYTLAHFNTFRTFLNCNHACKHEFAVLFENLDFVALFVK